MVVDRERNVKLLLKILALRDQMATEIVVALIGGGFLVLVALIGKIGSDNKKDHGQVHQTLGRIEQKIDHHVENHQ
jgi:hypothetical protein